MEPGAAAALLEDVTDRALRSEFKPDDGAGAGVVAEAVGDQSAQRPVITGSGDVMKVTMHFHNSACVGWGCASAGSWNSIAGPAGRSSPIPATLLGGANRRM